MQGNQGLARPTPPLEGKLRSAGRPRPLLALALLGLVAISWCGFAVWDRIGPVVKEMYSELAGANESLSRAFADEPRARYEGLAMHQAAKSVLVGWWRPSAPMTAKEKEELMDRVWSRLSPAIPRERYDAVVLATKEDVKVGVGAVSLEYRGLAVHRVYGAALSPSEIDSILDDD
jgi:hypothetical protein